MANVSKLLLVLPKYAIFLSARRRFKKIVSKRNAGLSGTVPPGRASHKAKVEEQIAKKRPITQETPHQELKLSPFTRAAVFEKLPCTGFTHVRRVAVGINGDVFQYQWRQGEEDTPVAVKKLRNSTIHFSKTHIQDERALHFQRIHGSSSGDALTEIGVMSYLSQQRDLPVSLLRMLGVFSEGNFTWLVTEFADGGELFDVAVSGASHMEVQRYTRQLVEAVQYLHVHHIGHRDISLENALLKHGDVKVMDFGQGVRSHSFSGVPLRYFFKAGKDYYRAPECYIPTSAQAQVTAPPNSSPGDTVMVQVGHDFLCEVNLPTDMVPGLTCTADIIGYAAAPADVFALGVCMFILAFQVPPWEQARLSNRLFSPFFRKENSLESMLALWGKTPLSQEAMLLLADMMQVDPAKRPSAEDCLQYAWLLPDADSEQSDSN
jgi:serine/threonine protein kinase